MGKAKKGAVQAVATALENSGQYTYKDNGINRTITLKAFTDSNSNFDAAKAEKGISLRDTANTLYKQAGYDYGKYSDNIDQANDTVGRAKAAAKADMEKFKPSHVSNGSN